MGFNRQSSDMLGKTSLAQNLGCFYLWAMLQQYTNNYWISIKLMNPSNFDFSFSATVRFTLLFFYWNNSTAVHVTPSGFTRHELQQLWWPVLFCIVPLSGQNLTCTFTTVLIRMNISSDGESTTGTKWSYSSYVNASELIQSFNEESRQRGRNGAKRGFIRRRNEDIIRYKKTLHSTVLVLVVMQYAETSFYTTWA